MPLTFFYQLYFFCSHSLSLFSCRIMHYIFQSDGNCFFPHSILVYVLFSIRYFFFVSMYIHNAVELCPKTVRSTNGQKLQFCQQEKKIVKDTEGKQCAI